MKIRAAAPEDVDAVVAIERASYSNPWFPESFQSLVTQERVHFLVAEFQGEVLGYAVAWWVMEQGELANLAVRSEWRGKGVGAALLDRILADAAEFGVEILFLEVRVSNQPAQGLYFSRGFTRVAVRKEYYRNPVEDAWVLMRKLHLPDRDADLPFFAP